MVKICYNRAFQQNIFLCLLQENARKSNKHLEVLVLNWWGTSPQSCQRAENVEPDPNPVFQARILIYQRVWARFKLEIKSITLNFEGILRKKKMSFIWPQSHQLRAAAIFTHHRVSNYEIPITHWKCWFCSSVRSDWSPTIFQNPTLSPIDNFASPYTRRIISKRNACLVAWGFALCSEDEDLGCTFWQDVRNIMD